MIFDDKNFARLIGSVGSGSTYKFFVHKLQNQPEILL